MARRNPHLHQRGSRFYFRKRVPEHLRPSFHHAELYVPLRTSDFEEARRRAKLCDMAGERLFERVENEPGLTRDEVARLARNFFQASLEAAEQRLVRHPPRDPKGLADVFASQADDWRQRLRHGDLDEAEPTADRILSALGVTLDKLNPRYREVCHTIARAQVELCDLTAARILGDYGAQPSDSLFATRADPLEEVAPLVEEGPLLSEVFKIWTAERKPPPKTLSEWTAAFRMFYEIVKDKPIKAVTREDIRIFKDTLLKLPASMSTKFRGRDVKSVLVEVGDNPEVKRLAEPSVKKYMTALSSVLSYAEANGYIDKNPSQKMRIVGPERKEKARLPYSPDDLKTIYSWPLFTGCASERDRKKAGPNVYKDAYYWLPILGPYTGCRVEELCQLLLTDVKEVRGIHVLDVNEEGDKKVKAASSRRIVPIHPALERLGFLEYVAGLRKAGQERLFPDLSQDKFGKWSSAFSKWWGRYQRALGMTDRRKVFHSFRHTFRDALREAGVEKSIADALMGHADSSMGGNYGQGFSPEVLSAAIQKIK